MKKSSIDCVTHFCSQLLYHICHFMSQLLLLRCEVCWGDHVCSLFCWNCCYCCYYRKVVLGLRVRMKHHALLFRIPSPVPNLYLEIVLFMGSVEIWFANNFSPNGTNCLSNDVFPSTTFLTSGLDASCMFHQPWQNRWFVAEWFICAAVNVTYDGF